MVVDKKNIDLSVQMGEVEFSNPVLVASGTAGYGSEMFSFWEKGFPGAICVKGLSLKPRAGNLPPRFVETPCGILNSVGYENVGIDVFEREKLPFLRQCEMDVIVNFLGATPLEYLKLAERLNVLDGLSCIEMNVSCPNVQSGGLGMSDFPEQLKKLISTIVKWNGYPLWIKLPGLGNVELLAKIAEDAGVSGISLINAIPGISLDVETRRSRLGCESGGLSGAGIYPFALWRVREIVKLVRVPVIGIGGVSGVDDALAMMIAGASCVQIGSAQFANPFLIPEIIQGMIRYCEKFSLNKIMDIIGTMETP